MMRWLLASLVLMALSGVAAAAEPSGRDPTQVQAYAARIREMIAAGTLPIIDVEHHWGGKLPLSELIEKMDRNGVALTWLGPNERNGSGQSLEAHRDFPDRLVPTVMHGDGPRWHHADPAFLAELEGDIKSGAYWAAGEFEARHYPSGSNNRDVHMPLGSAGFAAVLGAAQSAGIPLLIHHEAEDGLLPEMDQALATTPGAKVIWCHVGRRRIPSSWRLLSTPEGVREWLVRHPNLSFDLNQSRPGSNAPMLPYVDSVLFDPRNTPYRLDPAWRALLIEFPDRFVIGSDTNTARWPQYDEVIQRFRTLILADLPRDVAERIAFRNAWRLMVGQDWAD